MSGQRDVWGTLADRAMQWALTLCPVPSGPGTRAHSSCEYWQRMLCCRCPSPGRALSRRRPPRPRPGELRGGPRPRAGALQGYEVHAPCLPRTTGQASQVQSNLCRQLLRDRPAALTSPAPLAPFQGVFPRTFANKCFIGKSSRLFPGGPELRQASWVPLALGLGVGGNPEMGSVDLTSVRITSWRAARGLRGVARGKASSGCHQGQDGRHG